MYHAKRFIAPAIYVFMNRYSQDTYHSPIIYLWLILLVKVHKAGEPLTHSVLLFLPSFTSPHFNCVDRHSHLVRLSLWLPCGPIQSRHSWRSAHILLLWAFGILNVIVVLYIGVIVRSAILVAVIWIIQVAIPVQPIIGDQNAFRCTILVAFDCMTVDSPYTADIQDLSSSSREILCWPRWWQWWSFWQFKFSRTIVLKEWPGCFHNFFRVRNVSYCSQLLVLSARFLLRSM